MIKPTVFAPPPRRAIAFADAIRHQLATRARLSSSRASSPAGPPDARLALAPRLGALL